MTQPLITAEQIDIDSIIPVGGGHFVHSVFGNIQPSNGTSVIPHDNTVPLITEGSEIGRGSITRDFPTSQILVQYSMMFDASAPNTPIVFATFRNNTCIAANIINVPSSGDTETYAAIVVDVIPGAGSPVATGSPALEGELVYTGRVGVASAGPTWYLNETATGNNLGGKLVSTFMITEIK